MSMATLSSRSDRCEESILSVPVNQLAALPFGDNVFIGGRDNRGTGRQLPLLLPCLVLNPNRLQVQAGLLDSCHNALDHHLAGFSHISPPRACDLDLLYPYGDGLVGLGLVVLPFSLSVYAVFDLPAHLAVVHDVRFCWPTLFGAFRCQQ